MINHKELLELFEHIYNLKSLKRAGWVYHKVPNPESVADHSFGLALISAHVAQKLGLNVEKAVTIACIHDVGESIIGDITPRDSVSKEDKYLMDFDAVKKILNSDELFSYWQEFETGDSPEATMVRQLDKLEAYLQGRAYNVSDDVRKEFYSSTKNAISDNELMELLEDIDSLSIT